MALWHQTYFTSEARHALLKATQTLQSVDKPMSSIIYINIVF